MTTSNQHWNAIFSAKRDPELGWYERDAAQTLKFLDLIPESRTATIFLSNTVNRGSSLAIRR